MGPIRTFELKGFDTVRRQAWFILCLLLFSSCGGSHNSSEGLGFYPKAVGAADEASAIQSVRTIASAQAQLKATKGEYGTFDALTQAGLLDARFAGTAPNLKGYQFTMSVTESGYSINADPQTTETQPTTGSRHFYLDSSDSSIHVNTGQTASKSDPVL